MNNGLEANTVSSYQEHRQPGRPKTRARVPDKESRNVCDSLRALAVRCGGPRPAERTSATSPMAARDQPRHARSAAPTRTPAAARAPTSPAGTRTSSLSPITRASPSARTEPWTQVSVKPGTAHSIGGRWVRRAAARASLDTEVDRHRRVLVTGRLDVDDWV
jgi:hypothetical protein